MKGTKDYYDIFSEIYEKERFAGYHTFIDDMEAKIVKEYCNGKKVLDAGCGTGLIINRLKDDAKKIIGVDLSIGMLEVAKQRGFEVFQANLLSLPFKDNFFDIVYSFKVLSHIENIKRTLEELARVTKKGGYLILEFYNKHSLRFLIKKIKPSQKVGKETYDNEVYTNYYTIVDIVHLLGENLKLIKTEGIRIITPWGKLLSISGIKKVLGFLEKKLSSSTLKMFGGFLIVILKKE